MSRSICLSVLAVTVLVTGFSGSTPGDASDRYTPAKYPMLAGDETNPGDFDVDGWIGLLDFAVFDDCAAGPNLPPDPTPPITPLECLDVFDMDADADVDLSDFGGFQRISVRHAPIPLRDTSGSVITIDATIPYSGRQTCGPCHDMDIIGNGFKFQQGRTDIDGNVVMQDDFFEDGKFFNRSAGMYGRFRPAAPDGTWMSSKHNTQASELDKTAFYWVGLCGSCHVGGGPGELDQDDFLLYDQSTDTFGWELSGMTVDEARLSNDYGYLNPSDGSLDLAPWDQTGLSETDCMYCHRTDRSIGPNGEFLNWVWRVATLRARNSLIDNSDDPVPAYSAAGTAGQGWFSNIEFVDPPPPLPLATKLQIDYSVGVADGNLISHGPEGELSIVPTAVTAPPRDQACWICHDRKKRGERWFSPENVLYAKFNNLLDEDPSNDIPPEKSTACNYCHPGGLHHRFAKGNSFAMRLFDDQDFVNFRGCRECHLSEIEPGVPNELKHPDAPDVPGETYIHNVGRMMQELSCQACHIPFGLVPAGVQFDNAATGSQFKFTTSRFLSADPLNPDDPDKSRWFPALEPKVDSDGLTRLFPLSYMLSCWWGDWDQNDTPEDYSDDVIAPIALWRVRQITGGVALPVVTDDNGDGLPEVNQREEIAAYLTALKGVDNYGVQVAQRPVYVKGRHIWFEDLMEPFGVGSLRHEQVGIDVEWATGYSLSHELRRAEEAWGSYNDCQTCHRLDGQSPVFDRLILVDPYGEDGQPVYEVVRDMVEADPTAYHDNILLRNVAGDPITQGSTVPYSGRQTCGTSGCHDIDRIANGMIHQQGRTDVEGNIVMEDDFLGDGRWWVRSGGMYGRWSGGGGGLNRQTAGKTNENESLMDMTTFYWAGNCGGCHAGGGSLEFDRDGERLWDEATGLFGYEVLGQGSEDVVLDGDYAYIDDTDGSWSFAPWDVTGVADPECLHCHRGQRPWVDGADMTREWRAEILAAGPDLVDQVGDPVPAFAAAGTAGQGWYSVLDTETDPPVLQIDYSVGTADGTLVLNTSNEFELAPGFLVRPPRDQACWGCHLPGGFQNKRGTVWFDERDIMYAGFNNLTDADPDNDIPPEMSTACNRCHPGDANHNFAKGDSPYAFFRAELDWVNFRSCRECHLTEINGEPNPLKDPEAPGVPGEVQVHLAGSENTSMMERVSCQACHVKYPLERAVIVTDRSLTGTAVFYFTDEFLSADPVEPTDPDKSKWFPNLRMKVDSDGTERLFPQKDEIAIYWADWDRADTLFDYSDDTVYPIILWRVRQITGDAPLPVVTDDNGDGKLEVNRPEEIMAYIQALRGNDSYGRQVAANPVLVKGTHIWFEDPDAPGTVASLEHAGSGLDVWSVEVFGLDHNVLAAAESWGVLDPPTQLGCEDCHFYPTIVSPVFDREILMDPFGTDGQPAYKTVRELTGISPP